MMILALTLLVTSAAPATAQFGGLFGGGSQVPEISAQKLRELQLQQDKADQNAGGGDQTAATAFVLVDVRTEAEQQVSMLPGAITKEEYEKHSDKYQDKKVICYCTVGGRSGKYAKQLADKGIDAVNFKGSIIGWCEAELPLVDPQGQPTNRVHVTSPRLKVPSQYKPVW
jgi:rhodanese-related sulfurtransferase